METDASALRKNKCNIILRFFSFLALSSLNAAATADVVIGGGCATSSTICMQKNYFTEYFRKDIDCLGAQHKIHIIINNNNNGSSTKKRKENKSNK